MPTTASRWHKFWHGFVAGLAGPEAYLRYLDREQPVVEPAASEPLVAGTGGAGAPRPLPGNGGRTFIASGVYLSDGTVVVETAKVLTGSRQVFSASEPESFARPLADALGTDRPARPSPLLVSGLILTHAAAANARRRLADADIPADAIMLIPATAYERNGWGGPNQDAFPNSRRFWEALHLVSQSAGNLLRDAVAMVVATSPRRAAEIETILQSSGSVLTSVDVREADSAQPHLLF